MDSQRKRELLAFGYVKLYCGSLIIPNDIILLFIKWLSETLYINIEGDLLKEFLSKKPDELLKEYLIPLSDTISVKGMLYPNGMDSDDRVILHLTPIVTDETISHFHVYIDGGCDDVLNCVYKESRSLHNNDSSAYNQTFTSLTKYKNKNRFTLYINVELIYVQYKTKDDNKIFIQKFFSESPVFNRHMEFEWMVKNEELQNFKKCELEDWAFSKNFRESMAIYCTPKGFNTESDISFGLEIYKIPRKIEYFSANINIEIKSNIKIHRLFEFNTEKTYIGYGSNIRLGESLLSSKIFQNVSEILIFKVIIDITKVIAKGEEIVPESCWSEYGVLD